LKAQFLETKATADPTHPHKHLIFLILI